MKATRTILALSFVLSVLVSLAGCRQGPRPELSIFNYYLPGCHECAAAASRMTTLAGEFPGKIEVKNVDATKPDVAPIVESLGFKDHGLVIRGRRGEVLWKQSQHEATLEETRAALQELLAARVQA